MAGTVKRSKALKLPFGLHVADGRFVDASKQSVPNGAACGCVCPACGGKLIARNEGRFKIAHFAHGVDCGDAYETAIHEAAKQIIRELQFVWLPASVLGPKKKFQFTGHTLEKKFDRLIPDVTVWRTPERKLAVEIFVTHKVDEAKLATLRTQKLACVEFDLSELPRDINYEQLRKMLEDDALPSRWVFNQKIDEENRRQAAERRRQEAEERLRLRKLAALLRSKATSKVVYSTKNKAGYEIYHVPACPWSVRQGYTFANVNLDCVECRFCCGIKREPRNPWRRREQPKPLFVSCAGHVPEARELAPDGRWRKLRWYEMEEDRARHGEAD